MKPWKVGGEVGRDLAAGQAERIEVGGEMPAHAIGADQHHRADRCPRPRGGSRRGLRPLPRPSRRPPALTFSIVAWVGSSPRLSSSSSATGQFGPLPARAGLAFDHSDGVVHASDQQLLERPAQVQMGLG